MMETPTLKRNFGRLLPLLGIIGALLQASAIQAQTSAPQAQARASENPNIVIILADDMGYGDVSLNNPHARTHTPYIDSLGRAGIRFTDAHAGGAVCIPSRYGLITGRYLFRGPKRHGKWGYLAPLIEQGRETIGSLLQRAGYTTACIGKWHLGLDWTRRDASKPQVGNAKSGGYTNTDFTADLGGGPASLGFDHSFILPASLDMPPYVFVLNKKVVDTSILLSTDVYPKTLKNTVEAWDRKYTNKDDIYWGQGVWWRNGEMSRSFSIEKCLDEIVNEGTTFIKDQVQKDPERPFMLYLALTGPHTPWMPGEAFSGSSELGTYGDFVAQIDNVVHRITQTLRALNIEEDTLVIFSSDNGAPWPAEDIQTFAHRSNSRRGQKGDAWDGGHHIPLFIKWPAKITQPAVYKHPVSLVDLMATFADMTGQQLKKGQGEDSFSFYGVLDGNYREPFRDHMLYISSSGKLAVQKDGWKYIECLGSGGFTVPSILQPVEGGPRGQLYDLQEDPMELTNLYLEEPSKVKDLSELLDRLVKQGSSR